MKFDLNDWYLNTALHHCNIVAASHGVWDFLGTLKHVMQHQLSHSLDLFFSNRERHTKI